MKSGLRICALTACCIALSTGDSLAVPRGRPDPRYVQPEQIDPSLGTEILEAFRSARTEGDYCFDFTLQARPRKGSSFTMEGRMAGSWDDEGRAVTRSDISTPEGTLQLLYRGGRDGQVFLSKDGGKAEAIEPKDRFSPILPGLTIGAFELQMPFLFWDDYVYEGTRKLLGRPAHYFILYPKADFESDKVAAVRVAIDADFLVMLLAEELDANGKLIKEFRINGFQKVDGQWIIKEIDFVDSLSRDRTRFRVENAWVKLNLPKSLFAPKKDSTLPEIPEP